MVQAYPEEFLGSSVPIIIHERNTGLLDVATSIPSRALHPLGLERPEPLEPVVDIEHVRSAELLLHHGDGDSADGQLAQPDAHPARELPELHLPEGIALHAPGMGSACPLLCSKGEERGGGDDDTTPIHVYATSIIDTNARYVWSSHTVQQSMDQPGMVANPARGQLNRENQHSPVPVRAPENLVS